ncbi:hypothetical protein J437_LFUL015892 [Ladona fulva]|uniref:Uncharacterized protein n=1 Tax=Ladona fulva TaxID=123851 RepID=A0A8K0KMD8_LADFU|nr:hypothetical protein J437_LFUL015892 [Ladona fulva]
MHFVCVNFVLISTYHIPLMTNVALQLLYYESLGLKIFHSLMFTMRLTCSSYKTSQFFILDAKISLKSSSQSEEEEFWKSLEVMLPIHFLMLIFLFLYSIFMFSDKK